MKPITIIKSVCSLMFFVMVILNLVSILTYWRNVHNQSEVAVINGTNVRLVAKPLVDDKDDVVKLQLGIIKNCKNIENDGCEWPENFTFVGDTAIVVLQSLALVVYVINILVIILSIFLQTFPPRALYFLPLACFFATVFNLTSIIIFIIYSGTAYFPNVGKLLFAKTVNPDAFSLYNFDGDTIIGPYPFVITFAEGYYITIVTAVLSLIAICAAIYSSFKSVHDENEIVSYSAYEYKVVNADTDASPPLPSSGST